MDLQIGDLVKVKDTTIFFLKSETHLKQVFGNIDLYYDEQLTVNTGKFALVIHIQEDLIELESLCGHYYRICFADEVLALSPLEKLGYATQ